MNASERKKIEAKLHALNYEQSCELFWFLVGFLGEHADKDIQKRFWEAIERGLKAKGGG